MRRLLSHRHPISSVLAAVVALGWAAVADAEPQQRFFVEGTGGWGFQFGRTDYLVDGSPDAFKHPVVTGYAVGGTAGFYAVEDLAIIASYAYNSASSRTGDIPMVIDEVEGEIAYHTAVAGLRLRRPAGPGAIRVEFALGIIFPYETQLEIDYGAALAALPEPITGTGIRNDHYTLGVGGHGAAGYELPLGGPLYLAATVKIESFQVNNEGEETIFTNFVTDFAAEPPTATTATVEYGDGAERPFSQSAQDIRGLLSIGLAF